MRLKPVVGTNILIREGDEIRLSHTWHEVEVLKDIIVREGPAWFIEIGMYEGGLAAMIVPCLLDTTYVGIEKEGHIIRPYVKKLFDTGTSHFLMIQDCFNPTMMENFSGMKNKIIYCDGGNKPKELLEYKSLMNKGDFIFVHDFWDGIRKVHSLKPKDVHPEVHPVDIVHMETDPTFERYSERYLGATRIVGWKKK